VCLNFCFLAMEKDKSDGPSNIQQYKRLLFWQEDNQSVGAQISSFGGNKLFVGISKYWRQNDWKPDRWAPGKKGQHVFLTPTQFRALVSAAPKVCSALQSAEVFVNENVCENIVSSAASPAAAAAAAGPVDVVSGTGLANASAATTSAATAASSASTCVGGGHDDCDGAPGEEIDAKNAEAEEPSTVSKRKRGRPSKNAEEIRTPKACKPKSCKSKSKTDKPGAGKRVVKRVCEDGVVITTKPYRDEDCNGDDDDDDKVLAGLQE
jgi:hypothetical protein